MRDTALGEILIRMGVISDQQLETALRMQTHSTLKTPIGDILTSLAYCEPEDIRMAARLQPDLRSSKLPVRAMATASLATNKKRANIQADKQIVRTGKALMKKMGVSVTPTPVMGIDLPALKR